MSGALRVEAAQCVNDPGVGRNCGFQQVVSGGDPNTLYACNGWGPATVVEVCANGCEGMPVGVDDRCRAPSGPQCVNDPGVGRNCGFQHVVSGGDPNTLYACNGWGPATVVEVCANGCEGMPVGVPDRCVAPTGPWCAANAWGALCGESPRISGGAGNTLYRCSGAGPAVPIASCGAQGCSQRGSGDRCTVTGLYVVDGSDTNEQDLSIVRQLHDRWPGPRAYQPGVPGVSFESHTLDKVRRALEQLCGDWSTGRIDHVAVAGYSRGAIAAVSIATRLAHGDTMGVACRASGGLPPVTWLAAVDAVNTSIWGLPTTVPASVEAVHRVKASTGEGVLTTVELGGIDHRSSAAAKTGRVTGVASYREGRQGADVYVSVDEEDLRHWHVGLDRHSLDWLVERAHSAGFAVAPVDDGPRELGWAAGTQGGIQFHAVQAGRENGGQPRFLCQALVEGQMLPGKVVARGCNVGWRGRESVVPGIYWTASPPPGWHGVWVPGAGGAVPPGAARTDGLGLGTGRYAVCRAEWAGGLHPGRVTPGGCAISYGGLEYTVWQHAVLVD